MPCKPSDMFQCKNCGHCCKGYGGTYLSERELEPIAAFLGIDRAQFISEYCQESGGRWLVAQGADEYCVLWNNGCTIHPVKPRMCRAWPFIEGVDRDTANWHIMAGECPGIRTDVSDHEIMKCVKLVLSSL
jgi:Fe-S-cluster containining protein